MNLEKDVFRFNVAPFISPISINEFITQDKLNKPSIDSLIKAKGELIQNEFNSTPETASIGFLKYTTDNSSKIVVYVSTKVENLIIAELIEFPTSVSKTSYTEASQRTDVKRMKILFLLNDTDEIIEVEYQKNTKN